MPRCFVRIDVSKILNKRSGKNFKTGDLSNFVRRNKEIRNAFGDAFQVDNENNLFYFNTVEFGEINEDTLRFMINVTIKRLKHFAVKDDDLENNIKKSLEQYRLDCPLKQSHRSTLYLGSPSPDYFPLLEHLVYEELYEITAESGH
ncbi:MAG: hypothetical protein H0Z35_07045 [Thermoanaerobacteraceae bacterium]|nr:hypothetical protein [Thermoanaerobacteraceae bacterium]